MVSGWINQFCQLLYTKERLYTFMALFPAPPGSTEDGTDYNLRYKKDEDKAKSKDGLFSVQYIF